MVECPDREAPRALNEPEGAGSDRTLSMEVRIRMRGNRAEKQAAVETRRIIRRWGCHPPKRSSPEVFADRRHSCKRCHIRKTRGTRCGTHSCPNHIDCQTYSDRLGRPWIGLGTMCMGRHWPGQFPRRIPNLLGPRPLQSSAPAMIFLSVGEMLMVSFFLARRDWASARLRSSLRQVHDVRAATDPENSRAIRDASANQLHLSAAYEGN